VAQAVQLTQIARGALANCLRHAQARQVEVVLEQGGGSVQMQIADDGIGFDPCDAPDGRMGLQTMRSRATEAGGALRVESRPGAGTRVIVEVPVPADEPHGHSGQPLSLA
jgi:signal transduction histidine kinase